MLEQADRSHQRSSLKAVGTKGPCGNDPMCPSVSEYVRTFRVNPVPPLDPRLHPANHFRAPYPVSQGTRIIHKSTVKQTLGPCGNSPPWAVPGVPQNPLDIYSLKQSTCLPG